MNESPIDIVKAFQSEWDTVEAEFKDGEKEQIFDRGTALMKLFEEQFGNVVPTAVEKQFRLPLLSPSGVFLNKDIVGVFDCVADDTIIEYKTSAKSANQSDVDESIQLTLYSWAYTMVYGRAPKALKLVTLVRTKNAKIQVFESQRTKDDYDELFQLIEDVIRAVDLQVFYKNRINNQCSACVYREFCF